MEFRYRADDGRPPSFLPPNTFVPPCADGYFKEQALRAGFLGIAGGVTRAEVMAPISLMDPLQRAIEKERIREEMLREMVERRILEEEVRRELEMEQLLAMRRFRAERLQEQKALAPFTSDPRIDNEYGTCLLTAPPEVGVDEVRAVGTQSIAVNVKSSPLPALKLDRRSTDSSPYLEVQPLNKVSGNKRKAEANTSQNKAPSLVQHWSCALCQVNATSATSLNNHLQGKKHKTKVAGLESKKTRAFMNSGDKSKPKTAVANKEGGPNNVPKIVKIQVDGKLHQVVKKGFFLQCECCNVKCNSSITMATHLGGKKHNALGRKKHNALMEESKKASSPAGATIQTCDRRLVEKDLAAEADKKDIVGNEEESILEKGEEQVPDATETTAGEVKASNC